MRFADRVKETTTTSGTGSVTLAGAVTGFVGFYEFFTDGDFVPYAIVDGENIEIGLGTLASGSLERTRLLSVISAGAAIIPPSLIDLSGSSADVFCTIPAYFASQLPTRGASIALASGAFIS